MTIEEIIEEIKKQDYTPIFEIAIYDFDDGSVWFGSVHICKFLESWEILFAKSFSFAL